MRSLTLGEREIIALTDYIGPYVSLADLFPDTLPEQWAPYRARYPEAFAPDAPEMWRAAFTSYLVRSPGSLTLIDTGVGRDDPTASPGALMSELAACGVKPEQIATVVFTHLHSDHIGWNLTAEGAPTFPNAQYLFERAAWNALHDAAQGGDAYAAQASERLHALEALGVTRQFIAGRDLAEGCVSLSTDGHAPGHISVVVESRAGRALIVGDAFLHPAQVDEPEWASSYDEDAERARTTRGLLLDLAESDGLTLAVSHIPPDGFGRVIREGGARHWQTI
ncbi:MAG TPA: MBL fold metallo-hydrolase [Ktedonobacterales bacterium]|nr:MBL fold metallo-hydrolase [Ktedonobacterales bacterium]